MSAAYYIIIGVSERPAPNSARWRRPKAKQRPSPDLLAPRIAPASRLTSFGGYQPAVCGHPTDMISTRAHRSSDLLRKRASPGGYFTRAIYRGGRNHVGPANVLSCDSRLQAPDLSLMHRTFSADRIAPKHPLRSRAANPSRRIGRGASPRRPLSHDCRDFVRTVVSFHHFLALLLTDFW